MSKSFRKFKQRVRMQAILSAVLWGLALDGIFTAFLVLLSKLASKNIPIIYTVSIGAAVLIVAVGIYLALMPSDRKLAKRLDKLYELDEKVATMIELKEDNGEFASLQRDDADEKLGQKPLKTLKSKPLIAGLLVFCIALGSCVGALVVPVRADSGETPIDEFDRQWLITAINELISTVEAAYIDEGLKSASATELRSLLAFVQSSDLLSEMKKEAVKTVIAINFALVSANSAEAFGAQFKTSTDANIAELGKALSELSGTSSKKALEALGSAISKSNQQDASFTADELNVYLQSSGVRSDETLYLLFKSLTAEVKSNYKDADDAFESVSKTIASAVIVQNVNKATVNIVINKLCNLFGITESDITAVDPEADIELRDPSDPEQYPDDEEAKEPEGGMSSGGLGTGEVIYGSNDLVFDPYTGTYRPYGEIINDYFAKANEQITDGKLSDEISDAIEEYFDILFGGAGKN